MSRNLKIVRGLMVLMAGAYLACTAACGVQHPASAPRSARSEADSSPRRIVSMAPAITEVLYALGLGDAVVGVTRYCDYPPEATSKPQVGGYLDPNIEAIVALEPDLVVLMQDHDAVRARLEALGLATLQVDQHDVAGILSSIEAIAEACGPGDRGRALAAEVRAELQTIGQRVEGLERPRTLVVVERPLGAGKVNSVWVAGPDTFYDDLIGLAGGRNAYRGKGVAYPELSREGLLHLDPEVILDVMVEAARGGVDVARVLADWQSLAQLQAVRGARVFTIEDDYAVIPGPRVARVVELIARRLHPQADWDSP